MTILLVTNDDGIDSPALEPLVHALSARPGVLKVNALVPDRERSWISKAITRFDDIEIRQPTPLLHTASAYPADCVNLGIHSVFPERPDFVISGINLGCNHGRAFLLGSGTVGAASEGSIAEVPAVAFSIGSPENHAEWIEYAWSPDGREMWLRAAAVAADIVETLIRAGFPEGVDLLNVNFPADVQLGTKRIVTEIADTGYHGLFRARSENVYFHDYPGTILRSEGDACSDLRALDSGWVSITPVKLPHSAELNDETRCLLEGEGES
jgi:5'-nucleotidase